MASLIAAVILAVFGIWMCVVSSRHLLARGEANVYFFLCMAASIFWAHEYFSFASIAFAEESQTSGIERTPGLLETMSSDYRHMLVGAPWLAISIWLVLVLICLGLARLLVRARNRVGSAVPGRATSALAAARAFGLRLLWLVGPGALLYSMCALLLGDERYQGHFAYHPIAVSIVRPLMPLLTAYCWPALQLHPFLAPGFGQSGTWWDGNVLRGADPRGGHILPVDPASFLFACLPWVVLAVVWTWLHRVRRV